jgi:Spy/CpxP family protein refolding chaperone
MAAALVLALVTLVVYLVKAGSAQSGSPTTPGNAGSARDPGPAPNQVPAQAGLSVNDPRAFQGYTLIAPMTSTKTYLIDMEGKIVRSWESKYPPAHGACLLENGHLLRPGDLGSETRSFGAAAAAGGQVQEFSWEGEIVWDFRFFNERQLPHHDATKLPNGNVLMIVWDKKTAKEALAAGRRPILAGDSFLLPDSLIEIKPTGKTTGEVVWEWRLWDHLVQDFDKTKANYGNVSEHPELVNINFGEDALAPLIATKDGVDTLKSIGYLGANSSAGKPQRVNPDWTHFNSVAYNPELDQIVVSVHSFSEIWIIDHSTTTAEAASHKGGRSGKGGDLLYRWGNPRAYRAGKKEDQRLFAQHDAHWIPHGLPGEGHLLVFNNGMGRPGGNYSSVDEIVLPVDANRRYERRAGSAYGPERPIWSYAAPNRTDFYSMLISGAQRLPNGNTLTCTGTNGTIFEVTADKELVWRYANPASRSTGPRGLAMLPAEAAPGASDDSPQIVQIIPPSVHDQLKMSSEQKGEMEKLQTEATSKIEKILTSDQREQLAEALDDFGPDAMGPPAQPGQLLTSAVQEWLKLTPTQTKQVDSLQAEVDQTLRRVLTEEQRKQLKDMRELNRNGPGKVNSPGSGAGPPGRNSLFRAYRYAPNYPGLRDRDLKPGKRIEDLQPN